MNTDYDTMVKSRSSISTSAWHLYKKQSGTWKIVNVLWQYHDK